MVQTPLVAKSTDASSVLVPEMYAVVIEQVKAIAAAVLLNIEIASPSENVASGIIMLPEEPSCTYLPTSATTKV
jgi:hypothetical protein